MAKRYLREEVFLQLYALRFLVTPIPLRTKQGNENNHTADPRVSGRQFLEKHERPEPRERRLEITDAQNPKISGDLRPTTDPQVSNISSGSRHNPDLWQP